MVERWNVTDNVELRQNAEIGEDMTVLEGALKKLKDQKENFGYMDRFTVDENYEVMKLIEEKISNDTVASHSEQEIYKGCIALMQELTDEFAKWYEWVHGEDAIAELDDEEMFCLRRHRFILCKGCSYGAQRTAEVHPQGREDALADCTSDLTDLTWDIESGALSHTENADGEWETITFSYEEWAKVTKFIEELRGDKA